MAKRAANGSGTIGKRTINGIEYYVARYTVGIDPGTGKQKQKSIYGKTQKEVREKLREATYQLDTRTYIDPRKLSVAEWFDEWMKTYNSGLTELTRAKYEGIIKTHIKPNLGSMKIQDLDSYRVQKMLNNLKKTKKQRKKDPDSDGTFDAIPTNEPLSRKSLIDVKGVLHAAMEKAYIVGLVRSNCVDKVTIPRNGTAKKEITVMTKKQIGDFLNVISGVEYEMLFKVTLFTGLREGEVMGLQWKDIDFENGIITIDHQLKRSTEKQYYMDETKTHEIRRINPGTTVMGMLKQQKKIQAERQLKAGKMWSEEYPGLVFTNEFGHHYGKHTLYRNVQRCAEMIGVKNFRFHDLRHTFAVNYLLSGGDLFSLSKMLGHSTIKITSDTYGHYTDDMRIRSGNIVDNCFGELVNM